MNMYIDPFRCVKNEEIKEAIKRLCVQLSNNNYAVIHNPHASRLFAKAIPKYIKDQKLIMFGSGSGQNFIVIKPNHKFYWDGVHNCHIDFL